MVGFNCRGSTGAAPTTVFFGGQADNYSMLLPGHLRSKFLYDQLAAVKFLADATIWNQNMGGGSNVPSLTLGATITAPDGTSTGQQFLESTGNSIHSVQACNAASNRNTAGIIVLAGFFKYSGRRVVLQLSSNSGGNDGNGDPNPIEVGCQAVFDLLNGAIGVANTVFDNSGGFAGPWLAYPAEIVNFGNGWYRCTISAYIDNGQIAQSNGFAANVYADNGTGSGAASRSYAGDNTKGFYAWRINAMPIGAYALNSTVFFDGFDDPTLSNFDLLNVKDPTKTWFLDASSPWDAHTPTNPNLLSASGSVITYAAGGSHPDGFHSVAALSSTPPSGYVGQGWKPPYMIEAKVKWQYNLETGQGDPAHWTQALDFLLNQPPSGTQNPALNGREIDYAESIFGPFLNIAPGFTTSYYEGSVRQVATITFGGYAYIGAPAWSSILPYQGGGDGINDVVFKTPNYYTCLNNNTNDPPPSANWTTYVPPPSMVTIDFTNFNVWAAIVIPYAKGNLGQTLCFFNGICTAFHPHAPVGAVDTILHTSDGMTYPIRLGGGVAYSTSIDYFKIVQ